VRVTVIGGGPGGLYVSLLLKKKNPRWDITVIERNPPDATYGWGVVFSDRTLTALREADYKTYIDITENFVIWDAIDVWYRDGFVRCGGHLFAGIARTLFLNILQKRCEELAVNLKFETEIGDPTQFSSADLLIGADGMNSIVRQTYAKTFQPSLELGKAKYIWLGTDKIFDAFTFIFRENEHGLFQVHAYPFDGTTGTFIVECGEATWRRAGLDGADEAQSLVYCQQLFADHLDGHRLMSNYSEWINFIRVKNKTWHHENVVLIGDDAHTAHFSIGSGTKLAMEDAIALANPFEQHDEIEAALDNYEAVRKPAVEAFQKAAEESRTYFENVKRNLKLEPIQFTFNLLTRSGRISYDNLKLRDPNFVDAVDRLVFEASSGNASSGALIVAPPPMFTPLALRDMALSNRVVFSPTSKYLADDGMPNEQHMPHLGARALGGAGLVVTEPIAVAAKGRITPGCTGIHHPEHVESWKHIVEHTHTNLSTRVALNLSHAGRRGSTRPRWEGLDRPLRKGNWPLISASAIPYTPESQVPKEMDRAAMDRVVGEFVQASQMGHEAGFDMLQLNFAHGYLLGSFISPLTNQRGDDYGGSLKNRMRFPLEVFDAVREVWPDEKPIAVALSATDWVDGGFEPDDAIAVARILKAHGCDLITVFAGQTTHDERPNYAPGFLMAYSERVRNEASMATMTAGHLTTSDQVNTFIAAGRVDLCIMHPLQLKVSGSTFKVPATSNSGEKEQKRTRVTQP